MAETRLVLGRRVPDAARLAWARGVIAAMKDRDQPRSEPEVYAREAFHLDNEPERELKLQAIRVGDLGITAIPNEVYAITGLKIKGQSPFDLTMNVELANGSEGYIPPPEQHALGGYTTWPARTAGLEVQAEPKIVEGVLGLLEKVAGRPRRVLSVPKSPYAEAVLTSKPIAYWRLDEIEGSVAVDSSGHNRPATLEGNYALFLPGPKLPGLSVPGQVDRSVYLAGGRLKAPFYRLPVSYTLEMWYWNVPSAGIQTPGGPKPLATGPIPTVTWHHLALAHDGRSTRFHFDGKQDEMPLADRGLLDRAAAMLFLDTRLGAGGEFEGQIDEVALYDRALDAAEIAAHLRAARGR
jgi:hypothetical protein